MTVKKVEVDGENWTLNGDPSMRTVKYVQNLQMEMFKDKLSQERFEEMAEDGEELEQGDMMKEFIDEEGIDGMMDMMWDNTILGPVQTISLASDRRVTMGQVDDMSALTFTELREKAEEALGGDAEDFFERLNLATSLMQNQNSEKTNLEQNELPPGTRNLQPQTASKSTSGE